MRLGAVPLDQAAAGQAGHGAGHRGPCRPLARVVPCPAACHRAHAVRHRGRIDRGVRTALVTSGGQHYRAPRISGRDAARYLGLQQRLARQQKGSRRRDKTRQAMAKITARVTDRRRDWAEKVSTRLVRGHDVIVLEKLNTKGMTRRPAPEPDPQRAGAWLPNRARAKACLNRGILAACWGILGQAPGAEGRSVRRHGHLRRSEIHFAAVPRVRPHRCRQP